MVFSPKPFTFVRPNFFKLLYPTPNSPPQVQCVRWHPSEQSCLSPPQVQCVRWHPSEQSCLLTAGYDKKIALLDVRKTNAAITADLSADAEQALWLNDHHCLVSAEDGSVFCFDARQLIANGTNKKALPVWTLNAYANTACSGLAARGNILITGGQDGVAKVWDLSENATTASPGTPYTSDPVFVFEKNLSVGPIFSCSGGPDSANESMFLFGGCQVAMWDLRSEKTLCEHFGWKWEGVAAVGGA